MIADGMVCKFGSGEFFLGNGKRKKQEKTIEKFERVFVGLVKKNGSCLLDLVIGWGTPLSAYMLNKEHNHTHILSK